MTTFVIQLQKQLLRRNWLYLLRILESPAILKTTTQFYYLKKITDDYIHLINKVLNDKTYKKYIIKNSVSELEQKLNPNKTCESNLYI